MLKIKINVHTHTMFMCKHRIILFFMTLKNIPQYIVLQFYTESFLLIKSALQSRFLVKSKYGNVKLNCNINLSLYRDLSHKISNETKSLEINSFLENLNFKKVKTLFCREFLTLYFSVFTFLFTFYLKVILIYKLLVSFEILCERVRYINFFKHHS